MNYLIVNADDFGYSYAVNRGIVEAHTKGIVTSTSVLVNHIGADEAKELKKYANLSIGLHFESGQNGDIEAELHKQIEKFVAIVGKMPDHIDSHKINTDSSDRKEFLEEYSKEHKIPVRSLGKAKFISSFGINSNDSSVAQLERSIDEATNEYNELMTHCGYVDDYLLENSSYSKPREQELTSLCNPIIKQYLAEKAIVLVNWRQIPS